MGFGIASLITSLVGFGIVGVILGIVGQTHARKVGRHNGLAIAGIVIGGLSILIVVGLIAFSIFMFMSVGATCDDLGPGTHIVDGTTYRCDIEPLRELPTYQ
jgi:hypothetical protein